MQRIVMTPDAALELAEYLQKIKDPAPHNPITAVELRGPDPSGIPLTDEVEVRLSVDATTIVGAQGNGEEPTND